jgi:hypothetical protein
VERSPVVSSDLLSVGYSDEGQVLEVEFVKGGVYQYYGVPRSEYENLLTAPSIGRFFNANIKKSYPYAKQ